VSDDRSTDAEGEQARGGQGPKGDCNFFGHADSIPSPVPRSSRFQVGLASDDVQAAVVTVLSSKAAEAWNAGVRGFNVLRLPLPSPSKASPG